MKKWYIFAGVALVAGFFFLETRPMHNPYFQVAFLDIGQGDAILVTDVSGYQILIDGGPAPDSILRELEGNMSFFDRSIDMIVLTHPDKDHFGGLSAVLERYRVSTIVDNQVSKEANDISRFRELSQDEGASLVSVKKGDVLSLPSGAVVEVLAPDSGFFDPSTNNSSIVLRISYQDVSFLLTGDIDSTVESRLVSTIPAGRLQSTVLKVAHHGSRSSSSLEFLEQVNPQFAVASYGCTNSYGHPSIYTVRRYEYKNIPVFSTCDRGTIAVETDGETAWLQE